MTRNWLYSLGATLCLSFSPLQAQLWVGGTSTDWNTASNWNPAIVPFLLSARVNTNAGNMPVVGPGDNAFPFALDVGFDGSSGANTKLTIEPGGKMTTLTLNIGANAGSEGTLLVSGGELSVLSLYLGAFGKGTLDVRDGANVAVQGFSVGYDGDSQALARISGANTYLGSPDGNFYVGGGQLLVENGAEMEFSSGAVTDGGRFTVQGKGSRYVATGSFFDVRGSGSVEVRDGGSILTDLLILIDGSILVNGRDSTLESNLLAAGGSASFTVEDGGNFSTGAVGTADTASILVRGDGSDFDSTSLYTSDVSSVTLEDRGSFLADGIELHDRSRLVIGGGSLVNSGTTYIFDESRFLMDSGGFAVVKDVLLRSYARVRGEGTNLFAVSIDMEGEGALEVANGGTVSAGPISNGTIILKGDDKARGTVGSTEFSNNVILMDGGQVRAFANSWNFIEGRVVVLEEGGGHFDTNRRVVQILSPIVGEGALTKVGKGVLYLSGELDYTGGTQVKEGGLYLGYSTTKGPVTVDEGAFFGGIGTVDGDVYNAGFLDPGFSPGTIRVTGDLTLDSTSFLILEVASKRKFDRLRIDGTAHLDGKLRIYLTGRYQPKPGDEFAMLKAGEIEGSFSSVNPQFDAAIVGNQVVVAWNGNRRAYQQAAQTDNQREAASALEQLRTEDLGSNSDFNRNVRPILDTLGAGELRQAFDAIAPSQSVAFSSVAFARSKSWLPQMATRLEYARSRPFESNLTSLGASDMKDVVVATPDRLGVWLDGSGVFSQTASFEGLRSGDASTASGTVGVDYKLSETFLIGAYTGYIGNWTNFGGGTDVDSNGTRFGVYSTWQSGGFYLNSVVGGEWNAYDWNRHIVFPGIDRRASADTTGTVFETSFGGGYDWNITDRLKLGVFSGLEYTLLNVSGFTESGAGALDLDIDDQDADSLRTNLGVQGAWSIPVNTRILRPTLAAAWRHEYLDGSRGVGSQLVAGGGPGFNTNIPGSDRKDSLLLNAGFSMELTDDVTGYVYYTGDIAGTIEDIHSVNVGLRLHF